MKTIKVIDLLNKIANGKEVPKKIIHNMHTYEYEENGYYSVNVGYLFNKYNVTGILNDTLAIIEDTPKEIYFDKEDIKSEEEEMKKLSIEKKDNFYDYYKEDKKIEKLYKDYAFQVSKDVVNGWTQNELIILDKLDEIIDKVNGE